MFLWKHIRRGFGTRVPDVSCEGTFREVLSLCGSLKPLRVGSQTSVGYTQGKTKNPTYREVCSGQTGHVEAVQVEFNPAETSYKALLDVFWKKHDPTQKNRQVLYTLLFPSLYPLFSLSYVCNLHLCTFVLLELETQFICH